MIFERLLSFIEATAWPLALLIVTTVVFRKEITQLIHRLREIGPSGAKLDSRQAEDAKSQTGTSTEPTDILKKLSEVSLPNSQWVQEMKVLVLNAIQTHPEDQRQEALFKMVLEGLHLVSHERAYARIFGSQIRALQYIMINGAVAETQLVPFFTVPEQYFTANGQEYGFEQWIGFLLLQNLVKKDEGQDKFSITVKGVAFIDYLATNNLTAESRFL